MRKWFLLLWLCLLVVCAGTAMADTLPVSPEGMSLTEALALAKDGDVIELADGVYGEPAEVFPLTVTSAVTLQAAQGAKPVIDAPPFVSAIRVEADGAAFRGLDIRFRRHGFYVIGHDTVIENCAITLAEDKWRTSSCGVWLGGVYRARIVGCTLTECSLALAGPPLSERSQGLPVLTGMFEVGEELEFFTTHTIENCSVNGKPLFYAVNQEAVAAPADAGQIIIANCGQAVVEGADVSHGSMGMEIVYCQDVRVTRCQADDCGIFGIYLAKNEGGTVYRCSTRGTNHGIDIRASKRIETIECTATACDQGIFYSLVQDGLVRDCTVSETGQGYFFAAGSGSHIDRCKVINCENGFNIQKEHDMLITGCTLIGNTICAARLDGSPTIFSGNTLRDNWVAVMAYGDVPFVLTDNVIDNSGACGIYLRDIAFSRISGNSVTGSQQDRVQIIGEMSGTRLEDLLEGEEEQP